MSLNQTENIELLTIQSNRDNSCRFCKKSWSKGDDVFFHPDTGALCVDENCCNDQVKKRLEKKDREKKERDERDEKAVKKPEPKLKASLSGKIKVFEEILETLSSEFPKKFQSEEEMRKFAIAVLPIVLHEI